MLRLCHSKKCMDRAFRQGHLTIDFPTPPFDSALATLTRSLRVFWATLPFLATVTLVVYLPGKLATQLICEIAGIPFEGVASYFVIEASSLVLGCLVVPAAIFGVVAWLRTGRTAPLGESFRWGRRQFGRTLANQLAVEMTVALWGTLLIVPGVMAMVRLAFTDTLIAVEGDEATQPLDGSRQLTQGRRWRIFGVLLPIAVLAMIADFLLLERIQAGTHSRVAFALADSFLGIPEQLTTVATLLMYLGTVQPRVTIQQRVTKLKP